MAANTPARGTAYGENDSVTSSEFQTVHVQAYQSVNRHSSTSGWRNVPPCLISESPTGHFVDRTFTESVSANATWFALTGLPAGHSLVAVRVRLFPADETREDTAPDNLPSITLYSLGSGDKDPTSLATQTYTWPETNPEAAYEHEDGILLTATPASPVEIDPADSIFLVKIITEYAGNYSFPGTVLGNIQANVTLDVTEGGPDLKFW